MSAPPRWCWCWGGGMLVLGGGGGGGGMHPDSLCAIGSSPVAT